MKRYPTVLTIAGSDSGGGAGIQADLKTIAALGAYGASAITALTAQNTQGVRGIHAVPASFLQEQLEAVFEDIKVDAVKIGMINTVEVVRVLANILDRFKPKFVVFDPVMVSTSGSKLIQDETVKMLSQELFPRVDLITPNLDEAEILLNRKIGDDEDMKVAATDLLKMGCKAILLKGGHLKGPVICDVLAIRNESVLSLETEYIPSKNVHGTGCTLSSAIATYVALENSLMDAVIQSKSYIAGAIEAGKNIKTGHGSGPLNHSYSPIAMQYLS